ncbi:transposase [Acetobacteraceae bacterium KSS12]|uniref:Transposase n=2 Tax=Rhizosaccharibacter radicis TaxID=2782605 RepID=A0ABT1VTB0_9PROT|nr:transposase [Acetobacteraceae bacterium KSS12]
MESSDGKFRDELLAREVCNTLAEARMLIERWRQHCNTQRPHAALGYRPPAREASMAPRPMLAHGAGPASAEPAMRGHSNRVMNIPKNVR